MAGINPNFPKSISTDGTNDHPLVEKKDVSPKERTSHVELITQIFNHRQQITPPSVQLIAKRELSESVESEPTNSEQIDDSKPVDFMALVAEDQEDKKLLEKLDSNEQSEAQKEAQQAEIEARQAQFEAQQAQHEQDLNKLEQTSTINSQESFKVADILKLDFDKKGVLFYHNGKIISPAQATLDQIKDCHQHEHFLRADHSKKHIVISPELFKHLENNPHEKHNLLNQYFGYKLNIMSEEEVHSIRTALKAIIKQMKKEIQVEKKEAKEEEVNRKASSEEQLQTASGTTEKVNPAKTEKKEISKEELHKQLEMMLAHSKLRRSQIEKADEKRQEEIKKKHERIDEQDRTYFEKQADIKKVSLTKAVQKNKQIRNVEVLFRENHPSIIKRSRPETLP